MLLAVFYLYMVDNKQAFADYLLKEKNYSPLTARAYLDDLYAFEKFIQQEEPGAQLHEVVYGQVRSWIIYMSETEALGNRSINRKISSLKSFYKFLLKIKQVTVSPLQKHKALKTEKKVLVPFSEKEMQDVVTVNDFPAGFEGVRNRLVLELFYTTGMRRAELIGATHSLEEIQKYLDADSLSYLSLEGLTGSVAGGHSAYCTSCYTGNYPVEFPRNEAAYLQLTLKLNEDDDRSTPRGRTGIKDPVTG